jgi:hypothetical protein
MTDDEIRNYLRPKHNWLGIIGSVAGACAVAWSVAVHFANAPSREEFTQSSNRQVQTQLDMAVMKGTQERQASDLADIKVDIRALRDSMDKKGKH